MANADDSPRIIGERLINDMVDISVALLLLATAWPNGVIIGFRCLIGKVWGYTLRFCLKISLGGIA